MNKYISIQLQNGPIQEVGVNGCQIDDVIAYCRDRIFEFNNVLPDQHNESALKHLRFALEALDLRRKSREQRGVEGTSAP